MRINLLLDCARVPNASLARAAEASDRLFYKHAAYRSAAHDADAK